MAISEIEQLIQPPESPTDAGDTNKTPIVPLLADLQLPDDYTKYGVRYGSGRLCNGFIRVFNPFSPSYKKWLEKRLLVLCSARERGELNDYCVFPEEGGLLPWGDDENGNVFCWDTTGSPNDWSVVVRPHDGDLEQWGMTFSSFLAKAFTNQISVGVWHEPFDESRLNFSTE